MSAGRLLGPYRRLVLDTTKGRRKLLALEMARYFGKMNPALTARLETVHVRLPASLLQGLTGNLVSLKKMIIETHRAAGALAPADEGGAPDEPALDRAIASLEHLNESAEAVLEHLDELLTNA